MSETAPLNGEEESKHRVTEEDYAKTATFCGCGYFYSLCVIRWRRSRESRGGWNGVDSQEEKGESWGRKKLRRLKEMSEKVAGPKWKNFIRKFSSNNKRSRRNMEFAYDPTSYSLNFDDGDRLSRDFPAIFAAPVVRNGTQFTADSSLI